MYNFICLFYFFIYYIKKLPNYIDWLNPPIHTREIWNNDKPSQKWPFFQNESKNMAMTQTVGSNGLNGRVVRRKRKNIKAHLNSATTHFDDS